VAKVVVLVDKAPPSIGSGQEERKGREGKYLMGSTGKKGSPPERVKRRRREKDVRKGRKENDQIII